MTIEIEIMSGDAAWPSTKPLRDAVWPAEVLQQTPWGQMAFAEADLRVMIASDEQVVSHVGIYRREGIWKGRKIRIGGIGGVMTHPDFRRRGLASVALTAAVHTLKEERATDFALLFCTADTAEFYSSRGWKRFAGEVFTEQAGARKRFEALQPYVFYLKRAPHEGELDLGGLPW